MMTIAETVNIDALKARYERIARAVQDLRALLDLPKADAGQDLRALLDLPKADAGQGDVGRGEARDVANTLSNLDWMAQQARREYDRGDQVTALNTLGAWAAIVQGELATRLRVWAQVVTDPDQAAVITAWAESLGEGE